MKLRELLQDVDVLSCNVDLETEVASVAYDSRKVTPGALFVAITGFATDGNLYVPMALNKGAVAVVTAMETDASVPHIRVASDRMALAQIGANFFGHPARAMKMIGVTGTNGKTTTTTLIHKMLTVEATLQEYKGE